VRVMSRMLLSLGPVVCLAAITAGCGDFIRQDRASATLVIDRLEASSGESTEPSSPLYSDVITVVEDVPTIFADHGFVTMRFTMKDVLAAPSPVNAITVNRYRVQFKRSDGRDREGVDVPYAFTSAVTFTVPPGGAVTAPFELVRHVAKLEAPLRALVASAVTISTVAEVTFYGRDQAGNELSVVGLIGVEFGNFGDPTD
jgi:hypothetical protein